MLQIVIISKENCPFCLRAKQKAQQEHVEYQEITVSSLEEIPERFRGTGFRTVPQIWKVLPNSEYEFIGGFEDFVKYLNKPNAKTVFNKSAEGHITGKYPLFLGEDLGFADNINLQYPELERLFDMQMGQIWNHTEVDLTQDRQDMQNVDPGITDAMVRNLLWQTLADSVASRAIGSTIMKYVSNSSLQDLYNAIILFESIHSKTYLHIIRQTLVDPQEALDKGYKDLNVVKRSNLLIDTFDSLANTATKDEQSLRELILYCVVVLYLLESINFMASFAVTFGIAELGVFQGISQNLVLIARDEMLHALAGKTVLSILAKEWPETFKRLQPRFKEMFDAVVGDEHAWADYVFSEGRQIVGLNAKLLKQYVDYAATPVAKTLGIEFDRAQELNPLPYMESYIDSSKIQVAAQELQLTSYLVNAVKGATDTDISNALKEFA